MANSKKQIKYDRAYINMAFEWAKLSHCKRKQVGALIVKGRMIISDGFNGCIHSLRFPKEPHRFSFCIGE